jgi:hypothetical protein
MDMHSVMSRKLVVFLVLAVSKIERSPSSYLPKLVYVVQVLEWDERKEGMDLRPSVLRQRDLPAWVFPEGRNPLVQLAPPAAAAAVAAEPAGALAAESAQAPATSSLAPPAKQASCGSPLSQSVPNGEATCGTAAAVTGERRGPCADTGTGALGQGAAPVVALVPPPPGASEEDAKLERGAWDSSAAGGCVPCMGFATARRVCSAMALRMCVCADAEFPMDVGNSLLICRDSLQVAAFSWMPPRLKRKAPQWT